MEAEQVVVLTDMGTQMETTYTRVEPVEGEKNRTNPVVLSMNGKNGQDIKGTKIEDDFNDFDDILDKLKDAEVTKRPRGRTY
ncbi:uncharacterized protein G2W53_026728 [Senna tora]|uniref:Uncharacterized protein n=1 Tax=Senna tora TaxID=362788 RepID=A0A834TFP6_9FABA|nr:uncharacterized protein G2W53_026728 [Senna tora]